MNALKIVCEHYDTEIIDKAEKLNKSIQVFYEKIEEVLDKYHDIYNITLIGLEHNEEDFIDMRDKKHDYLGQEYRCMTWEEYQQKYNKYKTILDKFEFDGEDYDGEEYFNFLEKFKIVNAFYYLFDDCIYPPSKENNVYLEDLLDI